MRSIRAEAQAATGTVQAFEAIAECLSLVGRSGTHGGSAEIQHREGIIMRHLRPDDMAAAEATFRRALTTARSQEVRSGSSVPHATWSGLSALHDELRV
ncbi:MAG: hypothetical protein R3D57_12915 [Hyphomicrobiaceae bacterium]